MTAVDTLVLGAGASGLACRAALAGRREAVTLEAAPAPGGLLSMYPDGPFRFDSTVHVMFFRDERMRRAVESLLPGGVHRFVKENAVWQQGRRIDYPYQYHAHQLAPEVREACIGGLPAAAPRGEAASFQEWLLARYGPGFYRHFFRPYNEKLYGVSPSELECARMVWTLPSNERDTILRGTRRPDEVKHPGTHALYPRGHRGIAAVTDALLELGEGPVLCGDAVVEIDTSRRTATTASGAVFRYRRLVSSLPLPVLLRSIRELPAEVEACASELAASAVTVVRVGALRSGSALPEHWTYFPDPEIPFYRMTRLERISGDLCPPGGTALLLECPGSTPPERDEVLALLHRLGVLHAPSADAYGTLLIPYAYVLFRHGYERVMETIRGYLAAAEVEVVGRYGEWTYENIEGTIRSGLRAGERVLAGGSSPALELFGMGRGS